MPKSFSAAERGSVNGSLRLSWVLKAGSTASGRSLTLSCSAGRASTADRTLRTFVKGRAQEHPWFVGVRQPAHDLAGGGAAQNDDAILLKTGGQVNAVGGPCETKLTALNAIQLALALATQVMPFPAAQVGIEVVVEDGAAAERIAFLQLAMSQPQVAPECRAPLDELGVVETFIGIRERAARVFSLGKLRRFKELGRLRRGISRTD